MPVFWQRPRVLGSSPSGNRRPWDRGRSWAWLPIFAAFFAIIGSSLAHSPALYPSPYLLIGLNLVFLSLTASGLAVVFARKFLAHGRPGAAFLGCGTMVWAATGATAIISSVCRLTIGRGLDINSATTIGSLCGFEAALWQLAGVALLLRWGTSVRARGIWLGSGYVLALSLVGGIIYAALSGRLPIFFVAGVGGTLVRQFVLGSTVTMLLLTVALLRAVMLPGWSVFLHWYSLSLLLFATACFGFMFVPFFDGVVSWTSRASLWIGGVYMFVAAIAAPRVIGDQIAPVVKRFDEKIYSYFVAITIVLVIAVIRLVFLPDTGGHFPFIVFYPAVMLAALYDGRRAGTLATFGAAIAALYFRIASPNDLHAGSDHSADVPAFVIFVISSLMVCWIAARLQITNARLIRAEASRREELERLVKERTAQLNDEIIVRRQAELKAEQANRAKSNFLAAASHDLRQPFQALRLFLDVLNGQLTEPRHLKVVQNASAALTAGETLLHALLDVSKFDAGTVAVTRQRFALSELVAELAAQCGCLAQQKGLKFTVVDSSVFIESDPVLLSRLLRNLLSNAIKYTDRGRVLLGCRRLENGVRIEVWDTGRGIATDHQQHIFEEFYQIGNLNGDRSKGYGIGLAVVRRTADLLGHQITVRSWPGRGSVFAVTVCCQMGDRAQPASHLTHVAPGSRAST